MSIMQGAERTFLNAVMQNLGHDAVPEEVLKEAVVKAWAQFKEQEAPKEDVRFKLDIAPVSRDWAKEAFTD